MKTLTFMLGSQFLLLAGTLVSAPREAALRALGEGFRHILPDGLDHVAFLLGLFFLARSLQSLFWQVTWFTAAHSFTFGLAAFGLVSVPVRLVEVAVALSIAFVAVENVLGQRLEKWRPWLVAAFGLVHGLAFAHTMQAQPSEPQELLPRLFGFNLGIELGQLAVVGAAALLVRPWWGAEWYRRRIAVPASVALAFAGLVWAAERLFAGS